VNAGPDEIFARNMRRVREMAGVTQEQLAGWMRDAGYRIHRSAVAKIELGHRPVMIGEAVHLASLLGVDMHDLITDTDTGREHAAQVAVRALQHETAEKARLLREAELLYQDAADRLASAQRHVAELAKDAAPQAGSARPATGHA
jgi:transcriptional regulator with XRE-family HTH domain